MLEASAPLREIGAIWDHHTAEAASPVLRPLTSTVTVRYSIYPPVKDERLSRPEPTQVNDMPGVKCSMFNVQCVHHSPSVCHVPLNNQSVGQDS